MKLLCAVSFILVSYRAGDLLFEGILSQYSWVGGVIGILAFSYIIDVLSRTKSSNSSELDWLVDKFRKNNV